LTSMQALCRKRREVLTGESPLDRMRVAVKEKAPRVTSSGASDLAVEAPGGAGTSEAQKHLRPGAPGSQERRRECSSLQGLAEHTRDSLQAQMVGASRKDAKSGSRRARYKPEATTRNAGTQRGRVPVRILGADQEPGPPYLGLPPSWLIEPLSLPQQVSSRAAYLLSLQAMRALSSNRKRVHFLAEAFPGNGLVIDPAKPIRPGHTRHTTNSRIRLSPTSRRAKGRRTRGDSVKVARDLVSSWAYFG
jgi:hypothetical protein